MEDEVHFESLFTDFGVRRATRGPLRLTIYGAWSQESDPRFTLTNYLRCLVPGGQTPTPSFIGRHRLS
eukprot:6883850-Heterocapsa_arctica.AAC.1